MKINYKGVKLYLPPKVTEHQINTPISKRFEQGTWEKEEIEMLLPHINEESIVLELGGCVGVLSCLVNQKMTVRENMVVVEANPELIDVLNNNKESNKLDFHISHNAASWCNKKVNFNFNGLAVSGSIQEKNWLKENEDQYGQYKNLELTTVTPMDLEAEYGLKFNTLSCDIEGEENELLYNLFEYFKSYKVMCVEFHDGWNKNGRQFKYKYSRDDVEQLYRSHFKIIRNKNISLFLKK